MSSLESKNIYINGQTFCRLVECKSFSKTATLLKVNQSTISRRIDALEEELAKSLINRNTRHHEITPDGLRFYNFFIKHEESFSTLMDNYINNNDNKEVLIKLAMPNGIANLVLAPQIPFFLKNHPNLKLQIEFQEREIDLVKEDYDIVIQRHIPKHQTLKLKKLVTPMVSLYCTLEYKKRYGIPQKLEELATHQVVGGLNDKTEKMIKWTAVNKNGTHLDVDFPHRIYISTMESCSLLVKSGHLIVAGTDSIFKKQLDNQNIIKVLEDYKFANPSLYLVKNDDIKHPLVNEFAKYIEDCFIKHLESDDNHL